jgi:tetratricopeptide (TPR) repeat protein
MSKILIVLIIVATPGFLMAQDVQDEDTTQVILIEDMQIQIETTQALNDLYNFKFEKAEQQFRWLKQKYSWHPLPYFLLGLSEWWKIMPNMNERSRDAKFIAYMDTVVAISERLENIPRHKVEASFFLAAAHGFLGRLYSSEERRDWRKAAVSGKNALKYMQVSKGKHYLSPELLFGDALYNYFSVWVPENYPLLKPVMVFFPSGDKELGIKQLKEVSYNAFYTRVEAQVFLMRILGNYENERERALQVSEYLHETYPDNPYFHRYFARMLYTMGRFSQASEVSKEIIQKINSGKLGYEETSGRYAAFFLGQIYEASRDYDSAAKYYELSALYSEAVGAEDMGYYHYSLLGLGDYHRRNGDEKKAREYYKLIKKEADRKDRVHELARSRLKSM